MDLAQLFSIHVDCLDPAAQHIQRKSGEVYLFDPGRALFKCCMQDNEAGTQVDGSELQQRAIQASDGEGKLFCAPVQLKLSVQLSTPFIYFILFFYTESKAFL